MHLLLRSCNFFCGVGPSFLRAVESLNVSVARPAFSQAWVTLAAGPQGTSQARVRAIFSAYGRISSPNKLNQHGGPPETLAPVSLSNFAALAASFRAVESSHVDGARPAFLQAWVTLAAGPQRISQVRAQPIYAASRVFLQNPRGGSEPDISQGGAWTCKFLACCARRQGRSQLA